MKTLLTTLKHATERREEVRAIIDETNNVYALSRAFESFMSAVWYARHNNNTNQMMLDAIDPAHSEKMLDDRLKDLARYARELVEVASRHNITIDFNDLLTNDEYDNIDSIEYWSTSSLSC